MLKKLCAALMALFLTVTLFPQSIYAEEEPVETTGETVTEAAEETEEVPEEVVAEEEEAPEEVIIEEEEPAEEPEAEVIPEEEPEEEVIPEEEPAEEPEAEIIPEEEPEEEVIPEEEPAEEPEAEVIPEEDPAEEVVPEEEPAEEPEAEVIPEEEPVEEIIPEEEPEEEVIPEEEPAEEPEAEVIPEEEPAEEAVPAEEPEAEPVPEEEPVIVEETVEEKAEPAEATEYKLIFNPNGGTYKGVSYYEDYLDANGNYVKETYDGLVDVYAGSPTRTNYRFDGWYTTSACTGEDQTWKTLTLTKNKTLYAKWVPVYTVTFNANGGTVDYSGEATYKREVEKGETVWISASADRAGYVFDGWYTSKNFLASELIKQYEDYKPTKNITLYAKWAAAWTITLNANGGKFYDSKTTRTEYVKKGSALEYYSRPEKTGYVCRGWGLTASAKEPIDYYNYIPKKNITLYAVYAPEVIVKLDANGGKYSDDSTVRERRIGKGDEFYAYSSDAPTKNGYIFYAWYTSKKFTEATKFINDTKITKNTTLYARYVKYYTVTFQAVGGGKYGTLSNYDENGKTKVTLKVPQGMPISSASDSLYVSTKDGYYFDGWYLDSKGTASKKVSYYSDYIPRGNVTLYAKWLKQIKVVYNGNGGKTIDGLKTVTVYTGKGKPVGSQPNFTNGKKTFAGWYLDKALKQKVPYAFGYAPTKNTTFYAKWVTPVTITFNANGGKFSNKKATMAYSGKKGSELRQNVEKPTRAGYIFEGWYTSKKFTAASEVYDPYHYNVTKKATVYAKWIKAVTITYKAGKGYFYDGSGNKVATVKRTYAKGYSANTRFSDYYDHQLVGAGSGAEYYDGSNYPYPYYNEKYYFAGWYTDAKLTKAYDFSKKLTKSITLYAKYAKISSSTQVTLTIDPNGGKINNHYSNKVSVAKNTPIYDLNPNTVVPPKGKVLFGFTTKKNNPNTLIESGKVFKKNATVYAYYSTEYTIVLNANGGFSNSGSYYNGSVYDVFNTKTVKVTKGHPVGYVDYYYDSPYADHMLTNAKGLIFRGWYSDKACKKLVTYDLYSFYPTKNMVLYAKWGKPNKAGWQQSNGKWWYKLANGDYYKNTFHSVDNKLYYFDASGYICKGWKQVGERWYYLASSGAVTFGWKKISGNWYYFREDGSMATGSLKIGKKTYKFNKSGVCLNP